MIWRRPACFAWWCESQRLAQGPFGLLLLARTCLVSASFGSMPYLAVMLTGPYGFSLAQAALLVTVGTLAARGAAFPAGLAVDHFGARASLIISSFGSMSCLVYLAVSPHVNVLVFGAVIAIQGICVACHMASLRTAVPTMVPAISLSQGFGMSEAARITGKLLGPITTMYLIAIGAYRTAFMVSGLLYGCGAVCTAIAFQLSKSLHHSPETRVSLDQKIDPMEETPLASGVVGSAFIIYAVACAGMTQMTTWMPKYFAEIGQDGLPPLIFMLQSALAVPLLLFMGSYLKKWGSRRLLVAMIVGVLGMSLSYILVSWTATFTIFISTGLLIGGALLVELTVFPVVHVLVAQASPSYRMGFGFGLLGLSESIGAVAGVMLGTYLYSRAQYAEALGDYWLTFGIVCTAVVCMGSLWGLMSAGSSMVKSPKLDHTTSAH